MSGGEGGREPGGTRFVRPLRRELSKTFQKLEGDSLGRAGERGPSLFWQLK